MCIIVIYIFAEAMPSPTEDIPSHELIEIQALRLGIFEKIAWQLLVFPRQLYDW